MTFDQLKEAVDSGHRCIICSQGSPAGYIVEPTVRQHHGGDKFNVEVVFGTIELEQRTVFDGNRMGYESRTVTKDRDGLVINVGYWQQPLCWLVLIEPEPVRPWWARIFCDA